MSNQEPVRMVIKRVGEKPKVIRQTIDRGTIWGLLRAEYIARNQLTDELVEYLARTDNLPPNVNGWGDMVIVAEIEGGYRSLTDAEVRQARRHFSRPSAHLAGGWLPIPQQGPSPIFVERVRRALADNGVEATTMQELVADLVYIERLDQLASCVQTIIEENDR